MKIKSIEIYNMFSYYGSNKIEFNIDNEEKNINIIYGRNGNGKTSFINCVKLLFLGTKNPLYTEQLRKSVSENRTLSIMDYVIGNNSWYGILNQKAKKEGSDTFFIRIEFVENGKLFIVLREWLIKDKEFTENCTIVEDNTNFELTGTEAEKFLHKRIPPDFVDFFFFDGEQVQQIAEANRTGRKEKIVKLLNISGIEFISKILRKYKDELQNKSYENNAQQHKIMESKNTIEILQGAIDLINNKLVQNKNEVEALEEENNKRESRKKDIYLTGNETRANELNSKKTETEKGLLRLKDSLPNILSTSFFTFKSSLSSNIIGELINEIKRNKEQDNIEFANTLIETLPKQLLEEAPKINIPEDIKYQIKNKLEKLLEVYKVCDSQESKKEFIKNLSHSQLLQVQNSLHAILGKSKLHSSIIEIKDAIKDLRDIEFELKIINDDPEEQRELNNLEALINQTNDEIDEIKKKIFMNEEEIKKNKLNIAKLESEIELIDRQAKKNFHLDPQIKLSEKIVSILKEYKTSLEDKVKKEVEEYLNENYKQLIDSNNLIRSIKIEDNFDIKYTDENNMQIAMSSISAGMKQIVAMSLLWALKETTKRTIPVIIDTPLGRIDYGNQKNILKNYYPKASKQVIILPSDSEINLDKFRLIEQNTATLYKLENKSGVETRIVKINDLEKEVFNG